MFSFFLRHIRLIFAKLFKNDFKTSKMHFHNLLLYPLGKCAINQLNKPESLTPMRGFFCPVWLKKDQCFFLRNVLKVVYIFTNINVTIYFILKKKVRSFILALISFIQKNFLTSMVEVCPGRGRRGKIVI